MRFVEIEIYSLYQNGRPKRNFLLRLGLPFFCNFYFTTRSINSNVLQSTRPLFVRRISGKQASGISAMVIKDDGSVLPISIHACSSFSMELLISSGVRSLISSAIVSGTTQSGFYKIYLSYRIQLFTVYYVIILP